MVTCTRHVPAARPGGGARSGARWLALAILAVFAAWERASSHPMLNVGFFQRRRFSAAISSLGLVTFGLFGTLFVMTQFLQFGLGYSALPAEHSR